MLMSQPTRCSVALLLLAFIDLSAVAGHADRPAPQANPLFFAAHQALLEKKKQGVIDIYFLGDSITRRWQGTD